MTLSGDGGGPPCARAEVQAASLLRVLGRGGTGTVWLVADAQHPGEQRALKVVGDLSSLIQARRAASAALGEREGLFCSACYVCHGCGLSNTCEPQEARANIDCVNAFLKRQSSGSSHLGDRLKRPL